ncbi:hypothetical protein SAMN05660226_01668 [Parapedobacter luteus]|uniref:Holin-X, holin superfamily III n=1 Tax=Parapedobacter luteus TaxID=623280 RepID=A0A1T5BQR2_9SPHI|nr:hypothetical protein [Parapedobacter luteus]SKB49578.1 hypothetical protein SAMN05660226_01668 [Parapedobacter luteus]
MQKEQATESKFPLKGIFRKLADYRDTRLRIFRLKAVERAAGLIASVFVLFFLSLALGYYIGELFGRVSFGFLAVAGLYLVLLGLGVCFRDRIKNLLTNLSIRRLAQRKADEMD